MATREQQIGPFGTAALTRYFSEIAIEGEA